MSLLYTRGCEKPEAFAAGRSLAFWEMYVQPKESLSTNDGSRCEPFEWSFQVAEISSLKRLLRDAVDLCALLEFSVSEVAVVTDLASES